MGDWETFAAIMAKGGPDSASGLRPGRLRKKFTSSAPVPVKQAPSRPSANPKRPESKKAVQPERADGQQAGRPPAPPVDPPPPTLPLVNSTTAPEQNTGSETPSDAASLEITSQEIQPQPQTTSSRPATEQSARGRDSEAGLQHSARPHSARQRSSQRQSSGSRTFDPQESASSRSRSRSGSRFQSGSEEGTSRRSRTPRKASRRSAPQEQPHFLNLLSSVFLFGTMAIVLLAFAGRTPTGLFCLCIGTFLTVGSWLLYRVSAAGIPWRWTGLEPIFLLGLGLVILQLTPLPIDLLEQLSPGLPHLLGADLTVSEDGLVPSWTILSLTPRESRLSLGGLACVSLLFLVMVQKLQNREFARRSVVGVALCSSLYGVFATVQYLTSNGKFFWLIENAYVGTLHAANGSFTNANHFAGFVSLSLGPLLAWAMAKSANQPKKQSAWGNSSPQGLNEARLLIGGAGVVALLLAAVLSVSRGGILLAGAGIVIPIALLLTKRLTDSKFPVVIGVMALLATAGISMFGEEFFNRNALELATADVKELDDGDARQFVWQANFNAQQEFLWVGGGLGSHRDLIPAFHPASLDNRVYTHAENAYIQIGTELGMAGWILFSLCLVRIVWQLITFVFSSSSDDEDLPLAVGVAGSVAVFLTQGCYDFAWYAPAYMLVILFYVAYLFRRPSEEQEAIEFRRIGFAPAFLLLILVGSAGWVAPSLYQAAQAEGPTMRYLVQTRKLANFENTEEELMSLKIRLRHLQQALSADPTDGRNYLRLSSCLRRVYELNSLQAQLPMPVTQIRAAVYSGGFQDADAVKNWLNNPGVMKSMLPLVQASLKASQKAIACSPCFTGAWLTQADLCFVESPAADLPDYFIERARRVQPHSADIVFAEGYHAWNNGNVKEAITHWKTIFADHHSERSRILELTTPSFSPEQMVQFIEPDWDSMYWIARSYALADHPQKAEAAAILGRLTQEAALHLPEDEQVRAFSRAFSLLSRHGEPGTTQSFIATSTKLQPESTALRKVFGQYLFRLKEFQQAEPHLAYYLERVSHDPDALKMLQTCRAQREQQALSPVQPASSRRFR
ncbi:MAG: hypothetical protein CMJ47_11300 [Planctomyces sp.]|nr:hypothetical protein [Planctomyces sp.]